MVLTAPPLGLYVHLPWCLRKCPYCDFNSHAATGEIPADEYVEALIRDLEQDLPLVRGRPARSVYFGGGTPSLFSAAQIERLLCAFRALLPIRPDAEITLEANPGTVEHDSFSAYRCAGVNRISLGVQSFDDGLLGAIGRIHGRAEVMRAVESLHRSGMGNFNIDLMYGLPGQSPRQALADVAQAIDCRPAHISHYQLTLEPNTAFAADPPSLPGAEESWRMQEDCAGRLEAAGFGNYEISAWSRPGRECLHNLNYWRFGDYLGIGAGAHGKVTLAAENRVLRLAKQRHPRRYLAARDADERLAEVRELTDDERLFEFFLNRLRLPGAIELSDFCAATGLPAARLDPYIAIAVSKGLVELRDGALIQTDAGRRFNNDLQAVFLPETPPGGALQSAGGASKLAGLSR